tara:strand:+ start:305 stop:508 length:204 start_codon:yes stop_codon:yes gene_type:complete
MGNEGGKTRRRPIHHILISTETTAINLEDMERLYPLDVCRIRENERTYTTTLANSHETDTSNNKVAR